MITTYFTSKTDNSRIEIAEMLKILEIECEPKAVNNGWNQFMEVAFSVGHELETVRKVANNSVKGSSLDLITRMLNFIEQNYEHITYRK